MKSYNIFVLVVLNILLCNCASTISPSNTNKIVKQPNSAPDQFVPVQGVDFKGDNCKNPLVDPRSGMKLKLVSSSNGYGIYLPDSLNYGMVTGDYLKIKCSDGRPVGIIR